MRQQKAVIGVFVQAFPRSSETFIVTKLLGLLEAGYDVRIFTMRASEDWEHFAILRGRDDVRQRVFIAPPAKRLFHRLTTGVAQVVVQALRHPVAFWRFVIHCWRYRKGNPMGFLRSVYLRSHFVGHRLDVLHIEFDFQGPSVADLKAYFGCKLVVSSRGAIRRTTVLQRTPDALNYLFQFVDAYHFISYYLRDDLYTLGLSREVPYWIIEPAIDRMLFANHDNNGNKMRDEPITASQPLRILSVGRIAWEKGYEFAIDAVAMVRDSGIPVLYSILGAGEYTEAVQYAAEHYGLLQDGSVEFVGRVSREHVIQYYAEADVMLHAAVKEGFCNAVIEAQAMGLPVVTSDSGGLPENVADGETGFVVPRRNPRAMADKLIALAHDSALRYRMGQAGIQRVQEHFDIQQQIAEFVTLYEDILAQPASPKE